MKTLLITLGIVFLVIFILLILILFLLRRVSISLFGVPHFIEGYSRIKRERGEKPKSLSGMDAVYTPLIQRDFPQINIAELKAKAREDLAIIFNTLEAKDMKLAASLSPLLAVKLQAMVDDLVANNYTERFDDVKFHQTVISNYVKEKGLVKIVLEIGVEYFNYLLDDEGKLIRGDDEFKVQDSYDVVLAYIQDKDKMQKAGYNSIGLGLNCPNCGAPINNLGDKFCIYCGTGFVEINVKAWHVIDFENNDKFGVR